MVVAVYVVDSHTSPCLCLDALTSTNMNQMSSGDVIFPSKSMSSKKRFFPPSSWKLSSSFVDSRLPAKALSSKKQRKVRSLAIVNEVAGQYEDSFHDVKTQLLNLFTYKAVRTVLNQLYKMNLTQYWCFVVTNKPSAGKRFLQVLGKEKHELAERVMVT